MRRTREQAHEEALAKAQADLRNLEPFQTAYKAGCDYHEQPKGGEFDLTFFGEQYVVTYPDVSVRRVAGATPDIAIRLLILHYLIQADGTPPADQWIAFRELPDGRVYDPAFQGRSALRLKEKFGLDVAAFSAAATALGGDRLEFGDASYMFKLFPRLRMAVVLHAGDEEFGPAVNILFDGSAGHYLPTEDLAVLGGLLTSKLLKA
jgi:hypothetical protein